MLNAVIAFLSLVSCVGNTQLLREKNATEALYQYLSKRLTSVNDPAGSAMRQLQYWRRHETELAPSVHRVVRAIDGKAIDVFLIRAPSSHWPNTDFSMAVIATNGRIIDWRSCWTSRRTALVSQDLILEDVDGDGSLDIAFRRTAGSDVTPDRTRHTRPADQRAWWQAFAITSNGLRALFPHAACVRRLNVEYKKSNDPVKLEVSGVPKSVGPNDMFSCVIKATNTAERDLPILAASWFQLEVRPACGYIVEYGEAHGQATLKPGEAVSQQLDVQLRGNAEVTTLVWAFAAKQKVSAK
jgi:hypothetical protein